MSDEATTSGIPNPIDLWRQWYESATGPWWDATGKDNAPRYLDPFGLASAFAQSASGTQDRPSTRRGGTPDPTELWTQWLTAAMQAWTQAASGTASPARASVDEQQHAGDTGGRTPHESSFLADPITASRRWYEATSQAWSQVAGNVVGSEAFIEMVNHSVESYTRAMRSLRRTSEAQLSALQVPTRADVARVASLVVALEAKVERIEDALDDSLASASQSSQKRAIEVSASLTALEERLSRVESKMDSLLGTLADLLSRQQRDTPAAANGVRRGPTAPAGRRVPAAARGRVAGPATATDATPPPGAPAPASRRRRAAPPPPTLRT